MTDLEIYRPGELAQAAVPTGPLDDWITVADKVVKLSEVICQSPFVPDGLRGSVPATAAAILTGRELGIPPMTSLANIHVIHGKPGLSALVMRALIISQGHEWQDVEVTDSRVKVRGRRKGETEWTEASFTRDQAAQAKIALGGYPQDKLYARATSRLARRKFADVIAGMPYSAEELEDGDPGESAAPAVEAPKNGGQPAQRTARRGRATPQTASPAETPAPPTPPAESAGEVPLPPLPGEEETAPGPDTNDAQATTGQVGMMQGHFKRLGFEDEDREQRLATAATIAGMPEGVVLGSLKLLTQDQAKAVIDTLSRCKDRERLIAVLAAGDGGNAD